MPTDSVAIDGDFDTNGIVDFDDFFVFADHFGAEVGDDTYLIACDIDNNGAINFDDFFLFSDQFGKTRTYSTGDIPLDESLYNSIPLAARPVMGELPEEVDLSSHFPLPGDQGEQGSCVGWATAYLKAYQESTERGLEIDERPLQYSPSYIYNQIRNPNARLGCNTGSKIIDALNLLSEKGIASMNAMPYRDSECNQLPSEETDTEAFQYRIEYWRRINFVDLSEVKSHLASGYPIVVGMRVRSTLYSLDDDDVYDDIYGSNEGGHAVTITGYDDSINAFEFINSWGSDWGHGGYGWIDYDFFPKATYHAFVAHDVVAADNRPTIKELQAVPEAGTAPLSINMFASVTGGDLPLSYTWDVGDSIRYADSTASHTFRIPGTYTIRLTVADSDGDQAISSAVVYVAEPEKVESVVAYVVGDTLVQVGDLVTLDASGSLAPEGATLQYQWFEGPDNPERNILDVTIVESPSFVASTPGTYQFRVRAISPDDDDTATIIVVVDPVAEPVAKIEIHKFPIPGGEKMDFIWIEPGSFYAGKNVNHVSGKNQVNITRGFYLGRYEVERDRIIGPVRV